MINEVPILFVDFDGTVRKGVDELGRFVNSPADVEVFEEAFVMMQAWVKAGGRVAGVSNQGGVSLGYFSAVAAEKIRAETHRQAQGLIQVSAYCPHHLDAPDPLMQDCWCRKPKPGMVYYSLNHFRSLYPSETYLPRSCWMVGDRSEDLEMAECVGMNFLAAKQWRSLATKSEEATRQMMLDPKEFFRVFC